MSFKSICFLSLLLLVSCTSKKDSRQDIQTATITSLPSPTKVNTPVPTPTRKSGLEVIKGGIWVHDIALGPDNSVWLLLGDEILNFHAGTWSDYKIPDQLLSCFPSDFVYIKNLAVGIDNSLWVGILCKLLHFDGKTWTTFSSDNGLAKGAISDITLDASGKLWVGTYDGNVSMFDGEHWTTYAESNTTKLGAVENILALPDGILWLGGVNGVSRFDGKNWTLYEHRAEYGSRHWPIKADVIASVNKNSLWTFDGASGGYYFDTVNWTELKNLDRATFTSALAISNNDIWVGTLKGLFHFTGQDWMKISDNAIESIVQDKSGRIWIGTREGLYSYTP